jgi:hypothetical protein
VVWFFIVRHGKSEPMITLDELLLMLEPATTLCWSFLALALLLLLAWAATRIQLSRLRRAGIYPLRGLATMADVERLKSAGLSSWAMRCYREIRPCSLRQAKEAVEKLSGRS